MDTGNPWDSKPLAASTTTPFDNPFDSPAKSGSNLEGWADFSSSPVSTTTKTLDEDSEMSPVKADFEAAFGPPSSPVATVQQAVPDSTSSPVQATNLNKETTSGDVVTSSPNKSPNVTTTEENIP